MSDVENSSVPVEDLRTAGFGDEVEKVATAVAGYLDDGAGGNVAVVSDPYVFVADEAPATVVVEDDLYYRTITGKAYVNDLRSEMAFKTDVTERVLAAFDEAGIESPTASADVPGG